MADAPQGMFRFNGVRGLLSAQFVLTTGISPATCQLTIAPGQLTLRKGTLEISYAGETLRWRDCIVDRVDADRGQDGFEVWRLTILDRRWSWKETGRISGFYNQRLDGLLREDTKKTPEELLRLCLDELGERGYRLVGTPTGVWPEVSWDYTSPAEALAKLCDDLRLVVVLGVDDRISIEPLGYGPRLPRLPSVEAWSETLDPPERPDRIVIVGAPTRYNAWWPLEPVAIEADENHTIVPLDEVSYKPAGGWKDVDIDHLHDVDEKYRSLARRCVYRMFRIKPPLRLPGEREIVNSLERILPIDTEQVIRTDSEGRKYRKFAEVGGVFYDGTDEYGVVYESRTDPRNLRSRSILSDKFDIDPASGTVTFAEPMYVLAIGVSRPEAGGIYAPNLWLRTGVSLRDAKTFGWSRYEYGRDLPGPKLGTRPRYVVRDELVREVWEEADEQTGKPKLVDNRRDIDVQAQRIWEQVAREYETEAPVSAQYVGFVRISPSGAVPSVSWSINDAGHATTRASWQQEDYTLPRPTRKECRRDEIIREQNRQKRSDRAEGERLRRARA